MSISDFPEDPSRALVLLDTEGLNDPRKDKSPIMSLFSLAVLLSSLLVYNTKGTIDDSSIEKLECAARISEHIKVSSDEELAQHFPNFIWAVRDLTLELKINKRDVTPKQYLEHCLKLQQKESEVCDPSFCVLRRALQN